MNYIIRGTTRTLEGYRSRKRIARWMTNVWVRRAAFVWAIITYPVKIVLYNRAAPTIIGTLTAGALATVAYA